MTSLIILNDLISWIPDNVSVSLCSVPPVGQKKVGNGFLNFRNLFIYCTLTFSGCDMPSKLYRYSGAFQAQSCSVCCYV